MSEKGMLGKAFDNQPDPGLDQVLSTAESVSKRIFDAEYRADHDPLTGLLNKAAWKSELEKKIEASSNGELGILFIDLKDFKRANDEQGHDYGDRILVATADILKSVLRTNGAHTDSISFESAEDRKKAGRLGGDEFAIIVDLAPRENSDLTPQQRLAVVNERLRAAFAENEDIKASGVGMSVGNAVWEGQAADEFLKQADASMYDDKQRQIEEIGSYR